MCMYVAVEKADSASLCGKSCGSTVAILFLS